jgi:DNA-binding GntR family transcriptional regulator
VTRSKSGTRADQTFETIRADILGGRLTPGQRLKFPDLSETYAVSVSACREALTRLVALGLVVTEPHVGYTVMPLSVEDLTELTDARLEIESLVFRRSICEGDLEWERLVISAHHVLSRTSMFAEDDPLRIRDEWAAAHAEFHHALLAGCRNQRLLETASTLRDSAELYRRWSTALGNEPDRDLVAEHRFLCDLALTRDTDQAVAALVDHITHTRDLLLRASGSQPTQAAGPGADVVRHRP